MIQSVSFPAQHQCQQNIEIKFRKKLFTIVYNQAHYLDDFLIERKLILEFIIWGWWCDELGDWD